MRPRMFDVLTLEGSPTDDAVYAEPPWWQVRETFIDCESNLHRILVKNLPHEVNQVDPRLVIEFICEVYA